MMGVSILPALLGAFFFLPRMVTIPSATFIMGRSGAEFPRVQDDKSIQFDEQPAHLVTLSTFEVDPHPVSQNDWVASGMQGFAADASWISATEYAAVIGHAVLACALRRRSLWRRRLR